MKPNLNSIGIMEVIVTDSELYRPIPILDGCYVIFSSYGFGVSNNPISEKCLCLLFLFKTFIHVSYLLTLILFLLSPK